MEYKIEINNQEEIYDIGSVAKHASGAALLKIKNTVILATVAREDKSVEEDFLPLTVHYVEKSYAAGRIPGGYIKRETKPGDFETLTSRIIDRSLRPLFPKGYGYPTQIVVFVLSCDAEVDLQVAALNAASAALYLSDIPVNKCVSGVRVGKIDGELIINPTNSQLKTSTLDLYVAGTKDELLMIEMRAISSIKEEQQSVNEVNEEDMVEAINFAAGAISDASSLYEDVFTPLKKADAVLEYKASVMDEGIYAYIKENYKENVYTALTQMAKSERAVELKRVLELITQDENVISKEWDKETIKAALEAFKHNVVREMIVKGRTRADGRGLKDVRNISIATNILPCAHGSCLFTRGQTQALAIATLGSDQDGQTYDVLTERVPNTDKFMVNYNFPGFSVGEASPLRSPGRRELGHGNLAKRALEPTIDKHSLYTIRLVSEILESNGSSSMATVCGGALALRAAGVETQKLVAGVAMGLVFEDGDYAILTDIMGLEDHDGDMDFKVAGTKEGITALQMDIKLGGIAPEILKEALYQAKEGREHILNIMEEAALGIVVNEEILPKFEVFKVDTGKMVDIIGQGGKTIREIIEKYTVTIDLDREGGDVKIAGINRLQVDAAKEHILGIVNSAKGGFDRGGRGGGRDGRDRDRRPKVVEFEKDTVVDGVVKKVVEFGAFIELPGEVDGLLHVSKLASGRVDKVTDIINVGDKVKVRVLFQKGPKIELALESKE
ncbi:MAG: polyribonucleotide nucleotidyltransferase [Campylobacteraceae bacterium]|jgi:polyribonucleotide nucleotidyltransferase|nr:polyribonucleotide nucleotidyltransferase [Campylobacteraceae bacterium]